ncbi:MAG TPA: hypothetical protein VFB71_14205 [Ramlibacter sp.]|nr:hypothetical protein [Ramlibacter sp.]
MSLLVRAFPLRASPADLRGFVSALQNERKAEALAFYEEHGVTHESWYLQDTPAGPLVIGLTQVRDVATATASFAQCRTGFAAWFKEQVQALSGVDQNESPKGPPTTLVYEYSDTPDTCAHFAPPGA